MPPHGGIFNAPKRRKLLAFLVLALLISYAAAGLASRLAGSLALAAAAVLSAVAQILGLQSLDVLHKEVPPNCLILLIVSHFSA